MCLLKTNSDASAQFLTDRDDSVVVGESKGGVRGLHKGGVDPTIHERLQARREALLEVVRPEPIERHQDQGMLLVGGGAGTDLRLGWHQHRQQHDYHQHHRDALRKNTRARGPVSAAGMWPFDAVTARHCYAGVYVIAKNMYSPHR